MSQKRDESKYKHLVKSQFIQTGLTKLRWKQQNEMKVNHIEQTNQNSPQNFELRE